MTSPTETLRKSQKPLQRPSKSLEREVDLFHVKDVKKLTAKDYGFLVLGSPTRFGTMGFAIRGFLGRVKSEDWVNKPFAAFDTENPENMEKREYSVAEKIAAKLTDKKMNRCC